LPPSAWAINDEMANNKAAKDLKNNFISKFIR
jgi:hypothetical protein